MCDGFTYRTAYTLTGTTTAQGWTTFLRHPITHLLQVWSVGSTTPLCPKAPGRLHGLSIAWFNV